VRTVSDRCSPSRMLRGQTPPGDSVG
jgi:hypothetical protein